MNTFFRLWHIFSANYKISHDTNSLSFLSKNLEIITAHDQVNLFLDNDLAGKEASQNLSLKNISFRDASTLYSPYKDGNEFVMKTKHLDIASKRSRGKSH